MMVGPFQEADGAVSMRRILALFFALAAVALGVAAIPGAPGWYVFIPTILCVGACLLLLFFTTWADVATIVASWKGH
ncbi:MAG TPA: hypothetical protein PLW80_03900 [Spirochaetales bacterium]|nr:hypothetical protein [Spirochaetales bacterium]